MWDRLESIRARYNELAEEMSRQEVANDFQRLDALAREHQSLGKIVEIAEKYRKAEEDLAQAKSLADEGGDEDMAALIREEIEKKERAFQVGSRKRCAASRTRRDEKRDGCSGLLT